MWRVGFRLFGRHAAWDRGLGLRFQRTAEEPNAQTHRAPTWRFVDSYKGATCPIVVIVAVLKTPHIDHVAEAKSSKTTPTLPLVS